MQFQRFGLAKDKVCLLLVETPELKDVVNERFHQVKFAILFGSLFTIW
ncbi:hypothetical protein RG47T_0007 [Mucilaginibacter polytrichastri]|uniref:Uncharacterized protein n=1 Tax=Mucilaginibacter polytrichastri TaxID=1302689 RepID=A0A1Q5ZS33_9SPHI|nr:hypothetical protein RG47T_0007 [Mucilaginibacter polytrichastri]